jgi:hypothetical protein
MCSLPKSTNTTQPVNLRYPSVISYLYTPDDDHAALVQGDQTHGVLSDILSHRLRWRSVHCTKRLLPHESSRTAPMHHQLAADGRSARPKFHPLATLVPRSHGSRYTVCYDRKRHFSLKMLRVYDFSLAVVIKRRRSVASHGPTRSTLHWRCEADHLFR